MSRFQVLVPLCVFFALLMGNALSISSADTKRTLSAYRRTVGLHSSKTSKLTIQNLALELAKTHLLKMIVNEHNELDKIKESVSILQRDSCTNIKAVGKPVTHNSRSYTQGAWMKDPLGIMGTETIFVMKGYSGKNILEEYENMQAFKAGVSRKQYKLPYSWDGTGAVVFGPFLFYNRANTYYIVKYNLHTERIEAQIALSGYAPRRNYYHWGGYSGVDLAVDEQGLWVLWGSTSNSFRLNVAKIDVYHNQVTKTWSLSTEKMLTMGNAFVACGVVYCIDSYASNPTTINIAYDTKTGKYWYPNIQFTNQYGYNSMVDYNPREKVLYAWDNRNQVTYSLTFEEA